MNAGMEARQIIERVVSEYGDECFISEGYAAGDDLRDGIATALTTRDAEIAALRRALDDLASKVMNHKDAIRFDFSRDCDSARHEMWNAAESVLAKLPTPPAGGAHG